MTTDNKTLPDVQPGGRVRLGDRALSTSEGARRYVADFFATRLRRHDFGNYILTELAADFACSLAQHLSAQPSPAGQGNEPWPEIDRILADAYSAGAEGLQFEGIARRAAVRSAVASNTACQPEYLHGSDELRSRVAGERAAYLEGLEEGKLIAARQPVGELHLPPDGFYKIVFDDAEVPDESFARSGALDAALRRFEQISNKWNAHLFVRFANNTRDCTVPNATPAQAVDLGQFRDLAEFALSNAKLHNCWEKREALARELLALIDGKAVGK